MSWQASVALLSKLCSVANMLPVFRQPVTAVALAADDSAVYSVCKNGTIAHIDTETGKWYALGSGLHLLFWQSMQECFHPKLAHA